MKKKYIGKDDPFALRTGKIYDMISVEQGWYRIVDETGEDYLYPPNLFVDENENGRFHLSATEYIQSLLK